MSEKRSPKTWGTWEELLLACAVKRHGFKNWESVATELQTKTSLPHLLTTAQCCKQKYHDLKRRFKDERDHDHEHEHEHQQPDNKLFNIPWLEQLRKSRVDELKQEVQRYDLSILSLQLKVKKLEEERDHTASLDITEQKPDLDDKKDEHQKSSEEAREVCKRLVSGEESDRENRSVNESNSTGLSEKIGDGELIKKEEKGSGSGGMGPVKSGWKKAAEVEAEVESEELGDSATQLSSDVQSSASFGRAKRKRDTGDRIKADVKSEPLIWLLNMIRTHKHASLFESRQKSQEGIKYGEVVRQHVDVETIQTRVEKGSYASSILTFYRDVLLLFNNAIVYFPKNSLESTAAFQLRSIVSNEIKKETLKSDSSQDPPFPPSSSLPPQPPKLTLLECSDSLLAKQKSSTPVIVCRKRSSVSAKQSPASDHIHDDKDKKPPPSVERTTTTASLLKVKTEDNNNKAVTTGARSSRRSSRNPTPPTTKKHNAGSSSGSKAAASVDKEDTTTPKTDKKKSEASDKRKSVVDFLKRIKKNSPVQTNAVKKGKGGGEEQQKRNNSGKKDKGRERGLWKSNNNSEKKQVKEENTNTNANNSPSKRSVGRPAKKTAEASGGKRRRESGGKEVAVVKRQSKRARR